MISDFFSFKSMTDINFLKNKILSGENISTDEALSLADTSSEQERELWSAAREITRALSDSHFDTCSIVNARSGKCPENCKWCAQSAHYKTKIDCYPLISREDCLKAAELNRQQGIKRFSMVTSGRKLTGKDLDTACGYISQIRDEGGLELCASMGLLEKEELEKLYAAGVTRYHCNLEAAPSFFGELCSTHTVEDKIATITTAREIGFEICSGGIIGMGETRRQRIELALELRRIDPHSIPINILCPIPGTPLENAEPLAENEILNTLAFFRFVHPKPTLRFAGGRVHLSREAQSAAMQMAMNGAIMGDMLTTLGSQVAEDKELITRCGYDL